MNATLKKCLRIGRATKYLPWFRGVRYVQYFYRTTLSWLPPDWTIRINDFDGDLKLDLDIREGVGLSLWHRPELFDKAERAVFCESLKPGSVFLDVGANIGAYSLIAAKRGATVFAIEADPKTAALLTHHVKLNGFSDRVTVFNCAATDKDGTVFFFRNPLHSGCSGISEVFTNTGFERIPVEGKCIDSLNLPSIDICKMDVEGAEPQALAGMQRTIKRSPNLRLLVEYNPGLTDCRPLWKSLQQFRNIEEIGGRLIVNPPDHFCNLWVF